MRRCLFLTALMIALVALFPLQAVAQTVIYAAGADPDTLDPANAESNPSEAVNRMIYENLVKFDAQLNLVPGLAERWEQASDGMTWTFFLRQGIKFHDGTPFNAQAVKYFLDRMIGPEKPSRAGLYAPLVESAEVVDDYTVKFHMKAPFAFLLNNIAHSASGIVSPTAHQKMGKDIGRSPVGTGPFKFVNWVHGDQINLTRNDDYWGGNPKLEKIVFKTVREDSARVMMLQSGDAHLAVRIPSEDLPRLEKDPRIKLDSTETLRVLYVGFNNAKKPFDDPRVRQAFNLATDRESIVKHIYQDLALVASNIVAPRTTGYFPMPAIAHDPTKAKQLLAEAGFPNGLKAKFISPQGRYPKDFEMAQALQQQWQQAGIEVTLDTMEWAAYLAATRKPVEEADVELYLLGWAPSSAEARWVLFPNFTTSQWVPQGNNRLFYSNPTFDEHVEKLTRAADIAERDHNLKLAQEIIYQDVPLLPILITKETIGYSSKLKGVINSPLELTYFDHHTELLK